MGSEPSPLRIADDRDELRRLLGALGRGAAPAAVAVAAAADVAPARLDGRFEKMAPHIDPSIPLSGFMSRPASRTGCP